MISSIVFLDPNYLLAAFFICVFWVLFSLALYDAGEFSPLKAILTPVGIFLVIYILHWILRWLC